MMFTKKALKTFFCGFPKSIPIIYQFYSLLKRKINILTDPGFFLGSYPDSFFVSGRPSDSNDLNPACVDN